MEVEKSTKSQKKKRQLGQRRGFQKKKSENASCPREFRFGQGKKEGMGTRN